MFIIFQFSTNYHLGGENNFDYICIANDLENAYNKAITLSKNMRPIKTPRIKSIHPLFYLPISNENKTKYDIYIEKNKIAEEFLFSPEFHQNKLEIEFIEPIYFGNFCDIPNYIKYGFLIVEEPPIDDYIVLK
jgi:hypothetical protein